MFFSPHNNLFSTNSLFNRKRRRRYVYLTKDRKISKVSKIKRGVRSIDSRVGTKTKQNLTPCWVKNERLSRSCEVSGVQITLFFLCFQTARKRLRCRGPNVNARDFLFTPLGRAHCWSLFALRSFSR